LPTPEAAHRAVGVLQAAARPTNRAGHGPHRLVLADHALVQFVLQPEQTLDLVLFDPGQRHAGHARDDLGDGLVIDDAIHFLGPVAPLAHHLFLLGAGDFGLVTQLRCALVVGVLDRLVLLHEQPFDLAFDLRKIRRLGHAAQADARTGLVDDVNGLVRLDAASDVAVGQLHGRGDRLVGDLNAVVSFVTVAQPLQDEGRLLPAGLLDDDLLKTAFERAVLLDVLAVLIQRGRTDALDLAAREGRLEHVGGINGAFRAARSDQRVQLVNEQDDVAGPADLVHDRLDPLLELAAVLGAGHHHGQVQDHNAPIGENLGDFAADDLLGQTLNNGGLAHAGLTQQHRVVLLTPAQDLDHSLDLALPANDRVELAFPGHLGQVAAERIQGRGLALALFGGFGPAATAATGLLDGIVALIGRAEQVQNLFTDIFKLEPQVHEHLGRDAVLLPQEAQQQMFSADVVVVEVTGLFNGVFDDLFGPRSLGQLAHCDHVRTALDQLLHFEPDLAQVNVKVLKDVRPDP
jgi:hypothetical protein